MHLSGNIPTAVTTQQVYASEAFKLAGHARSSEDAREAAEAAEAATKAAIQAAFEAEQRKVRKDPRAASYHGGFDRRKLQLVEVGGSLKFATSQTKLQIGNAPPLPSPSQTATPAEPSAAARPTGDGSGDDAAADDDLSPPAARTTLLTDSLELPSPRATTLPPLMSFAGDQPPALPPPSVRLSQRVPPRVDGTERPKKVGARNVSEMPASANPNLMNLLLEVPYKRGVHTVSVNQRYLNHEPTFDAAFELLPARADFGALQAGCVYRLALKLLNVSNLSQRFSIKQSARAKVVYTPGVVAAGMSTPLEVELCEPAACELREVLTIVTEREEISLPVSATFYDSGGPFGVPRGGVRLLATAPRDPELHRTVAATVADLNAGTKRFLAPTRNLEYTKPDFFAEPPSDDDEPPAA